MFQDILISILNWIKPSTDTIYIFILEKIKYNKIKCLTLINL